MKLNIIITKGVFDGFGDVMIRFKPTNYKKRKYDFYILNKVNYNKIIIFTK